MARIIPVSQSDAGAKIAPHLRHQLSAHVQDSGRTL